MKINIGYGDIMKLAEAYGNATAKYCEGKAKPGELSDAHNELNKAVLLLEYLAFKNPPCKICIHCDEPPTFRACCDCYESKVSGGWTSFIQLPHPSSQI